MCMQAVLCAVSTGAVGRPRHVSTDETHGRPRHMTEEIPAIAVVRRELYDEGFGFCVSLWSLSGRRLLAVAGALIGPWP